MWDMFLSNLNSNLLKLNLQNFSFLVQRSLLQVIDYVNLYSRKLFEPKGFKLSLWLLEVS